MMAKLHHKIGAKRGERCHPLRVSPRAWSPDTRSYGPLNGPSTLFDRPSKNVIDNAVPALAHRLLMPFAPLPQFQATVNGHDHEPGMRTVTDSEG